MNRHIRGGIKAFALLSVLALASSLAHAADAGTSGEPAKPGGEAAGAKVEGTQPTPVELEAWRQKILHTPQPKKGCFTASYPDSEWREVPCIREPMKIHVPKRGGGTRTANVGGADPDFVATVTGHIMEAEGSFDSVAGVTSEVSSSGLANLYGFQLNTNFFHTMACSGSPDPTRCWGWEQFLLSSFGGAGIQYWMLDYGPAGTTCPAPHHVGCMPGYSYSDGWCESQDTPTGPVSCVANSVGVHALPASGTMPLDITRIGQVKLRGRSASAAGSTGDSAVVTFGTMVTTAPGDDFFPDLGTQWQEAEFNLFGSCCAFQAQLNTGSTLVVRVAVIDGTMNPPGCAASGFTGESNNLTLVDLTPPVAHTGTPALVFRESNAPGSVQVGCAGAVSVGDTHITTFDGAYYDFQASGDFILAEDGPDFEVQARQASGAPTWPNASVNKAVAIRMGGTRVGVYIEPTRVEIDGAAATLADGDNVVRPSGVQVSRRGNLYWISDERGNSVRATLNSTWIDVSVSLGLTPHTAVRGLLGNPNGNAHELVTAEGVVLQQPVLFRDLYRTYAESWRVPPKQSLFTGETSIRFGVPTKPFYARDLPREKAARARTICKQAGVKEADLLDSCVLDTVVLGDKAATKVFVTMPAPRGVIKPVLDRKEGDRRGM